jgi:prepilin-type N-terminal cleavage/methylation domain-containing protein
MDPRHRDHRANERGFTMVEALVTLVVFGVGILSLMQLSPRAVQFANRGKLLSSATNAAQAKVEELRALPSNDPQLEAGVHVGSGDGLPEGFLLRWQVDLDNPLPRMRRVEVRVRYSTASNDSVATLVTYF